DESDAVTGADVVLRDRAGSTHRDVQARGAPVDPTALADIVQGVYQQHDVAVVIGPRRGDVERTGAERLRPMDATQSIAWLERTDAGELGATPLARRTVDSDKPGGAHGRRRRVELRALWKNGEHPRVRKLPRGPPEACPRARRGDECRADSSTPPADRADRHGQRPNTLIAKARRNLPFFRALLDPGRNLQESGDIVDAALCVVDVDVPRR